MLDDSFAHLEGQIEPVKTRIALLQMVHNAEGVPVVFKTVPEMAHLTIKLFLTDMGKRRMAQIVGEREGLGKFLIETEGNGNRAGHLRHFDRVRQAVAKVVRQTGRENLGL